MPYQAIRQRMEEQAFYAEHADTIDDDRACAVHYQNRAREMEDALKQLKLDEVQADREKTRRELAAAAELSEEGRLAYRQKIAPGLMGGSRRV